MSKESRKKRTARRMAEREMIRTVVTEGVLPDPQNKFVQQPAVWRNHSIQDKTQPMTQQQIVDLARQRINESKMPRSMPMTPMSDEEIETKRKRLNAMYDRAAAEAKITAREAERAASIGEVRFTKGEARYGKPKAKPVPLTTWQKFALWFKNTFGGGKHAATR